jgi:hypothetical protein
VKIFGGGILFLLLRIQAPDDYDLRLPFLAFSIAIFGHGVLLFRCRRFGTTRLLFYGALPVPPMRRLGQYALFCVLLLLPEMAILCWLTPHPVKPADSIIIAGLGVGLLLLLMQINRVFTLSVANYLRLCLVLFGILYCFVMEAWG